MRDKYDDIGCWIALVGCAIIAAVVVFFGSIYLAGGHRTGVVGAARGVAGVGWVVTGVTTTLSYGKTPVVELKLRESGRKEGTFGLLVVVQRNDPQYRAVSSLRINDSIRFRFIATKAVKYEVDWNRNIFRYLELVP